MSIQLMYLPTSTREYCKKEKEVKTPAYFCTNCTNNTNSFCSFYGRRINGDFNRCFNHSNYSPVSTKYRTPTRLNEIIEIEEKKRGV